MAEHNRTVIVGGGISGLTAATSLAKRGVAVLLIEKNETCGGLVNSFTREGFLFDGGVRALENAGMVKPMLEELEIDIPLYGSEVSVGIEDEIIHVETTESVHEYEMLLKHMYPESHEDVERVIGVIRKFDEYMQVLFGSDSPFFKDARRNRRYYFTTFISWIFRFLATGAAVLKMRMPVEEFLDGILTNRSLNDVISQHFFKATPAFFAMSYFSLYTDYFYPEGGVGRVAKKLTETLVSLGAEVLTQTDIGKVDPVRRCVTDQHGTEYGYQTLIWAADLKQLYRIAETDGLPAKNLQAVQRERERILSAKGAESVFSVFMAVDQPHSDFEAISRPHFFYTPSRSGLGDLQRGELGAMLADWNSVTKERVLSWLDSFCRLNTYEISIPVLSDPQAAPEGKTGLIASLLLEHELVTRIKEDGWYDEFKSLMQEKMIDVLTDSVYPELKNRLIFAFSSSPLDIVERVRSSEGAIVGWSFEQPVPIDSSMLNMKNSIRTALPDILKIGQWAASPAGVPTCILTARLAADLVYKDWNRKRG